MEFKSSMKQWIYMRGQQTAHSLWAQSECHLLLLVYDTCFGVCFPVAHVWSPSDSCNKDCMVYKDTSVWLFIETTYHNYIVYRNLQGLLNPLVRGY